MKHFREVLTGINPAPLLEQLAQIPTALPEEEGYPYPPLPVMWRHITEWTGKKDRERLVTLAAHNIVLRYCTLGQEKETGRLYLYEGERDRDHWDRPAFEQLSAARPIVQQLLAAVGDILGHVIITRLPPGGVIKMHTDQWPGRAKFWNRYQVPLAVPSACRFVCGDEELWMPPGTGWYFDNWLSHEVANNSSQYRISMIVDAHPFG